MTDKKPPPSLAEQKLNFLLALPWMKVFAWTLFLLAVYAMRSFFTVIFLTFLLAYMATNIVKNLTGIFGPWEWMRKVIVLVTFAIFFFVTYSGGKFIAPHILEQGRGVVAMVQRAGLDRGIKQIVPELYAHYSFWRYAQTPQFTEDFQTFGQEQDLKRLTRDEFLNSAAALRREFRERQIDLHGRESANKAEFTDAYVEAYRAWEAQRVAEEHYLPPEKKARYDESYERPLIENMGQAEFEAWRAQRGEDYNRLRQEKIVSDIIKTLDAKTIEAYRQSFRNRWIADEGTKAAAALENTPQWEEKFRTFYENEKRADDYLTFRDLEQAESEEAFIAILGEDLAMEEGKKRLEEKFRKEKLAEYARTFIDEEGGIIRAIDDATGTILGQLFQWLQDGIRYLLSFGFDLILSVFLSFVIVWDLPELSKGVTLLSRSRARTMYHEIMPGLTGFGRLLGQSFQARFGIAIANTALILGALMLFDVGSRAFLCTIVFIGSFIPVVGVVMSGIPIILVGLQEGGPILALQMTGTITAITIFESLVLDPKILGDVLNLHTLLVLIVLTVGGHFFGVWGLLLGVPVAVYIINDVIMKPVAARSAETAPKPAVSPGPAAGTAPPDTGAKTQDVNPQDEDLREIHVAGSRVDKG